MFIVVQPVEIESSIKIQLEECIILRFLAIVLESIANIHRWEGKTIRGGVGGDAGTIKDYGRW